MAASQERRSILARVLRRRWLVALVATPLVLVTLLAAASWWLTEPLEDRGAGTPPPATAGPVPAPARGSVRAARTIAWPSERLEGRAAKSILLDCLMAAAGRLERVSFYTAVFHKRERISGLLGAEQIMAMKVRQQPFAIYFKFLAPKPGKEVVYAEGHHDNKVIAHSGGVAGWLVPRLAVPPNHPLALAENRHAVTEAGLANLTNRLIAFRKMDLDDPEAITILDRAPGPDGRPRSVHLHPRKAAERPFARVEVIYDPDTFIPVRISNYDWPEPGQKGDLLLAEHYAYEQLDLDADLTSLDFDPANPAYAFHR